MSLYRHLTSEPAVIAAKSWKPSVPVIGREFEVPGPLDRSAEERRRPHRYAIAYLTAFLIVASIFGAYTGSMSTYRSTITYNPHSPIYIDGNADLLTQAGNEFWSGTGAAGDPIEIRDYEIDGTTDGYGICLFNTNLHVNIDLCYIYNAFMYGIYLENATNVTILRCDLESCYSGIGFYLVSGSGVVDTNCSNSEYGVYLDSSDSVYLSNVTCDLNTEGVYAYNVTYGRFVNSTFSYNSDTGIWFDSSSNMSVDLCRADYNDYGVYAYSCVWTLLTNSTFMYESSEGVYVESSHMFMVSNNTITGSSGDGIYVDQSYMFFVADNNLSDNSYGAYLYYSENFGFEDNNISLDGSVGVMVEGCSNFGMRNNTCLEGDIAIYSYMSNGSFMSNTLVNSNYGIYALSSSDCNIGENNCSYNSYGIYVDTASGVDIWNNTCSWCWNAGIYTYAVTYSRIQGNNCSNGSSALLLVYSDNNDVSGNTCSGNSNAGIDLEVSNYNFVQNNVCDWDYDGIYLASSLSNTLIYNKCGNNTNIGIEVTLGSDDNILNMNLVCDNIVKGIQIGLSKDVSITRNFCRSNPQGGIAIEASTNVTLGENNLVHNGVWLGGNLPEYWYSHHIDQTNQVNGKPVVYVANQTAVMVSEDAGQVLVANSAIVLIEGKVMRDATAGLEVGFSNTILLNDSDCGTNMYGAYFYQSSDFATSNSSFTNTDAGVYADMCSFMMVDNCTISGSLAGLFQTGIYLTLVSNGYVKDNVIGAEWSGIYLNSNDGIQMWDNTCNANDFGMNLVDSMNINVHHNTCNGNVESGIYLDQSDFCMIENNTLANNRYAIHLFYTGHCWLANNTMTSNGIFLNGYDVEDWTTHTISTTNTANGRPVYYMTGATLGTVPNDGGQVILAGCSGMSLTGADLSHASIGVSLGYSDHTQIRGVDCSGGYTGIYLFNSGQNSISYSNFSDVTDCGIYSLLETGDIIRNNTIGGNRLGLFSSQTTQMRLSGNLFYYNHEQAVWFGWLTTQCQVWNNTFAHNNGAVDNSSGFLQAWDSGSSNTWYDPVNNTGNWWNDWTWPDSNGDGIVDNPYVIQGSAGSMDAYPLVEPVVSEPIPQFAFALVIPLAMILAALVRKRRK